MYMSPAAATASHHLSSWRKISNQTIFKTFKYELIKFKILSLLKNQAYSEYQHVLANILRSLFVARMPPVEARSPGRHSNVENAPRRRSITGEPATATSHIRRAILRTPPVTRQSPASSASTPRRAFALCRHIASL